MKSSRDSKEYVLCVGVVLEDVFRFLFQVRIIDK